MMEPVTIKQVKTWANVHGLPIYAASYCALQDYVTRGERVAYVASRVYGWCCDIYLFRGFLVATGYRPFGTVRLAESEVINKVKASHLIRFK